MRRTRHEQIESALPHYPDLNKACRHFADGPEAERIAYAGFAEAGPVLASGFAANLSILPLRYALIGSTAESRYI